jgi:hypothetical protein
MGWLWELVAWRADIVIALCCLILWHSWESRIKPRLIGRSEIADLAGKLISRHGEEAEKIAFMEEDRAWRYSDVFLQGKWRRVRIELIKIRRSHPEPK